MQEKWIQPRVERKKREIESDPGRTGGAAVAAQAVSKWKNVQSGPDISMLPKLAVINLDCHASFGEISLKYL